MIKGSVRSQSIYSTVTLDRLKAVLHYDPLTGIFTWINPASTAVKAGDIAGWFDEQKGYFFIAVEGTTYPQHVLAWFYMTGEWRQIDHKDRIRRNNEYENLRPATAKQNTGNQGVRYTNQLGVKGVQKRGNRYRAYITHNYKTLHLGTFDSIDEAVIARQNAAKEYFGEFSNG